jgi:ribosome-associated protein
VNTDNLRPELRCAIEAAQNKKAAGVTLLDLTDLGAFTGWFLICTAFSTPQVAAIADEIEGQLHKLGLRLEHREGRNEAEWVLLDYGSFLVHIFTERARLFYDLERLWRPAKKIVIPDVDSGPMGASGDGAGDARQAKEAD